MKLIEKLLTKNLTKIPLLRVDFNYRKFQETGNVNSCTVHLHPVIKVEKDETLAILLGNVIDYIRDNYNMDEM